MNKLLTAVLGASLLALGTITPIRAELQEPSDSLADYSFSDEAEQILQNANLWRTVDDFDNNIDNLAEFADQVEAENQGMWVTIRGACQANVGCALGAAGGGLKGVFNLSRCSVSCSINSDDAASCWQSCLGDLAYAQATSCLSSECDQYLTTLPGQTNLACLNHQTSGLTNGESLTQQKNLQTLQSLL